MIYLIYFVERKFTLFRERSPIKSTCVEMPGIEPVAPWTEVQNVGPVKCPFPMDMANIYFFKFTHTNINLLMKIVCNNGFYFKTC